MSEHNKTVITKGLKQVTQHSKEIATKNLMQLTQNSTMIANPKIIKTRDGAVCVGKLIDNGCTTPLIVRITLDSYKNNLQYETISVHIIHAHRGPVDHAIFEIDDLTRTISYGNTQVWSDTETQRIRDTIDAYISAFQD